MCDIDKQLLSLCEPDKIEAKYWEYKKAKLDNLLSMDKPTVLQELIASGATYQEIRDFNNPSANFPASETVTIIGKDGKKRTKPLITIPMGADGITYQKFEQELDDRVEDISKRLKNGKYLFYPFREVIILKDPLPNNRRPKRKDIVDAIKKDRVRILSIASIRDAIVQRIIYEVVEKRAEKQFARLDRKPKPVSFAYRKNKSAAMAAHAACRHMKNGFVHVLDADLRKFFDKIPTKPLLNVCEQFVGSDTLTYKLLHRFIKTDRVEYLSYNWARDKQGQYVGEKIFQEQKPRCYKGEPRRDCPQRLPREAGVPQGGVLSGLLANLYLHSFDEWVINDLAKQIPLHYVRYADDFLVLTRSAEALPLVYDEIYSKLTKTVSQDGLGLQMHCVDPGNPEAKTRFVDVRKHTVKFVGFEISHDKLRIHPTNIKKFKERWQEEVESERDLRDKYPNARERLCWLIHHRLRYKIYGHTIAEQCSKCNKSRMKRRSWIAFFSSSPDWRQIKALDKWMRRQIYKQFREDLPDLTYQDLKDLRLPSLFREYYRVRDLNRICSCYLKSTLCKKLREQEES
ncbi:hypothetical protein IH992_29445 [Candidatus Poribacteria bacterium]|nr:hypothetical protein [Candidatus Poribacteria bacterium]